MITARSATLSSCGTYRTRLDRVLSGDGPVYAFFGVNPSTADADLDDATVRKWTGFVHRWGGSRYIVGNPFSHRATDVKELRKAAHPVGPDNYKALLGIIADADILVPCWGNRSKVPAEFRFVLDELAALLFGSGKPVMTFGLTTSGDPMHPLMLGYDTPLQEWRR